MEMDRAAGVLVALAGGGDDDTTPAAGAARYEWGNLMESIVVAP
jgi:hypothetical protein